MTLTTLSEENYLKTIYHLGKQGSVAVSTNSIAEKMNTKASSVTDMVKKLAEKELVNYKKYYGVNLTEKGRITAIGVIRNHRLWEVFLVDKLKFSWDEVHDLAEELEHVKSKKLTDQLDAFLGFPTHDPHGDPIPNKNGQINKKNLVNLLDLDNGSEGVLWHVTDSSAIFLKYLSKNNLSLGDKIKVLEIEPFDNSIKIKANTKQLNISENAAKNLYLNL